jgi:hypothetical protein
MISGEVDVVITLSKTLAASVLKQLPNQKNKDQCSTDLIPMGNRPSSWKIYRCPKKP